MRGLIAIFLCGLLAAAALAAYLFLYLQPRLPALDVILDYQPKIPLRIYTADQVLIGEFGEEHREFIPIKDIPDMMKKSLLAIEDTRFYEHHGIDYIRAFGAALSNLRHGFGHGGGSTITMQVARNFFLTREKVASRKLNEVMLAYKIEAALSKDQILELYMNQIYLGQRSFGFGAAAQTYFGKPLKDLSIAEMAMLAGLPQNPARHNPAVNPKRAHQRQQVVLKRLLEVGDITDAQYQKALKEPLRINNRGQEFDTHAEYVAELARQAVYAKYQDDAYTRGISVTTTILKAEQDAAYESVRRNVLAYDQRHGYRGPEAFIDLPSDPQERDDAIDEALLKRPNSDRLIAAVVTAVSADRVTVESGSGDEIEIRGDGLRFAAQALSASAKPAIKLRPGAVIRISQDGKKNWAISQVPQVAAAFVALDANTGAYHALVGGFDYNLQKFNHVTQAWRQPGSAMKPFIYSAALEKGFSPATLINDVPLELNGPVTGGKDWAPQNDDGKFEGPVSMRYALAQSKNVPSIRILRSITIPYAHEFIEKFGFDQARQPNNLTMALGTGSVTPVQMAGAYALFANGGHQVEPYLIARITDARGALLSETRPPVAGDEKTRALDSRNAYVMDGMLREVARSGTGSATARLGRGDIAGKTGTTNDAVDGWFAGYGGGIVGVAWMGYDDPKSLGGREFGATVAVPIWIDYMRTALDKRPQVEREVPQGLTQVDGEWMYDEFIESGAVRTLDMDDAPAAPAPAATDAPPATTAN
ncbi:penicillin-binding protein 1A [Janthinobacterium agaricidamnosum]|uniref:Penicillin-binding protein 1A n=1 Tax=Janthinobacterium agaricidamnosum NBRC 102515 = DSM 9628 TaxID=1349767 RepID=W0V1U1_9BURK|nr:PBP1A family penicillin-binding protein [Janthinobacterium agaricidamnosum]CDG82794.1 mrcA; penicillin-binding 1 (Peptidoglycan synthetase) transmembrane protein [Janthinobacterium agaricidamnosum NBRC 102515 = DSM 9628]